MSCRDFLTGFHKRNVIKKEAKKAKAIEREKQERLENRREVPINSFLQLPINSLVLSILPRKDKC